MRTPKTLLIAGTLVLVSLTTFWWNQRTVATQRASAPHATAHVAERVAVAETIAASPAAVPPLAAPKPSSTVTAKPRLAAKPRAQALQCPVNIATQHFRVRADRDTLLHSKGGCTVKVPANAFVSVRGVKVKGAVDLQLREVLKPIDFVLGNMVTVYKGKALESGGSFCLEAVANGEALSLADGKLIDMAVPTRGAKSGMKVFPGRVVGDAVEWLQPRDLMVPVAAAAMQDEAVDAVAAIEVLGTPMRTNAWYRAEGFGTLDQAPKGVREALMKLWWSGNGLMITKDSVITVAGQEVTLTPGDTVNGFAFQNAPGLSWDGAMAQNERQTGKQPATTKGTNAFRVDPAANYIFQVKELGWANIDRLMYDKGAKPVDIITRVDNKDVGEVYISMVVKSRGMYLPGYEMNNGSYSFSHGDQEKMQLPIGTKATILATAYADGKPYVSIQDIVIAEKLNVDLHLEPTTKEGLRSTLEARL